MILRFLYPLLTMLLSISIGLCIYSNVSASASMPSTPSPHHKNLPEELASWIDTRAAERLAEEKSPGISLAVVIDGKLAFQKGYGVNSIGDKTAPPLDTKYQIASVTKTFVGTLAAKMAADGRVDLDVPVTDYVPDLKFHPSAQNAPISLRLLLSHQAGFARRPAAPAGRKLDGLPEGFDVWISPPLSVEGLLKAIATTPNIHPVGERYAYSGLGTSLAAYILAKAGGYEIFEDALTAEILKPLGMKNTFVRTSSERDAGMATPYAFTNNKYNKMCPLGTEKYYQILPITFGTAVGSSGLTSTTGDLALYLSAVMAENEVITPEAKDILFSPNVEFLYTDELVYQVGLAWRMGHFGSYGLVYQHTGYNVGHHASILVSDDHNIGVIALTNGSYLANRRLAADVMLKLLQHRH
ncbi:MAG: serine hydrolase domain-containing protein [Pseudomonadota bacterium]